MQAQAKAAVAHIKTTGPANREQSAKCNANATTQNVTIGAPPISATPKRKSQIFCARVMWSNESSSATATANTGEASKNPKI